MAPFTPHTTPDSGRALISGDEIPGLNVYPNVLDPREIATLVDHIMQARFLWAQTCGLEIRTTPCPQWFQFVPKRLVEQGMLEEFPHSFFFILYPRGSCQEPHKDAMDRYGDTIAGISLLGESKLLLQSEALTDEQRKLSRHRYTETCLLERSAEISLPSGSAYVLRNYARYECTHATRPISTERISITMRN